MDFKVGDVVKLKSGGPKMTIESIGQRNSINPEIIARCVWFENNQDKEGKFLLDTIILCTEDMNESSTNNSEIRIGF